MHQCGLYIVGSSVSGFGGESSDMDLCLVISGHDVDQRFHALEYLYRVQKALKQCRTSIYLNFASINFKHVFLAENIFSKVFIRF